MTRRLRRKETRLIFYEMATPLRDDTASYEEDKNIREKIKEYAKEQYIPQHPKERYMNFIRKNLAAFSIEEVPPKSKGMPYVYRMFCIEAQYVMGNCLEECIDIAIAKIKNKHH